MTHKLTTRVPTGALLDTNHAMISEILSASSASGQRERFDHVARGACYKWSFFTTLDHGLVGMGTSTVQEGDLLVVLYGGRVPFVLRNRNQDTK